MKKLKKYFQKNLFLKVQKKYSAFSGYTLPSFVKDWLIKKYTDEHGDLDEDDLKIFLSEHIAQKESNLKGSLINDNKETVILARILIEPDIKSGVLRFSIPDIGIKNNEGQIPQHIANKFQELKGEKYGCS